MNLVEDVVKYALMRNKEITCDALSADVQIVHSDGSFVLIKNALYEERGPFVVVFGEHQIPMVFCKEDLSLYRYT